MEKKRKMFLINHGTYPFDILVCFDVPRCEIKKHLKRKFGLTLSDEDYDKLEMEGDGRTVMLGGCQTVMRINSRKNKASHYANIAHEVFHAVEFLFWRAGLRHHVKSGEAWAYQIAHLTRQIYENLCKK